MVRTFKQNCILYKLSWSMFLAFLSYPEFWSFWGYLDLSIAQMIRIESTESVLKVIDRFFLALTVSFVKVTAKHADK